MFEQFTDDARKVMALANQEAQRFNQEFIGTEHILVAMLKLGSGVACDVLRQFGFDLHTARGHIERLVKSGPQLVTMGGRRLLMPRAKRVIEFAIEEAQKLGHESIGAEFLLLGVLRESDGVGAQALISAGVDLADVRNEVIARIGAPPGPAAGERAAGNYRCAERLTSRARKALDVATREAQRSSAERVGDEHLLLGLVREGSGVAAVVLRMFGVDVRILGGVMVAAAGGAAEGRRDRVPDAGHLIERAAEEARRIGHHFIGTEHLLLGVLGAADGAAVGLLGKLGVKAEEVRAQIHEILGPGIEEADSGAAASIRSALEEGIAARRGQAGARASGAAGVPAEAGGRVLERLSDELFRCLAQWELLRAAVVKLEEECRALLRAGEPARAREVRARLTALAHEAAALAVNRGQLRALGDALERLRERTAGGTQA